MNAEVLDCFFTNPDWDCGWEGADVDPANGQLGPQIVRTYLSRAHLEEIENACPMVALPSDVARGGVNARKAYQTAFEAMVEILQQGSQNDVLPSRKSALAIAALCIGGMVIAQSAFQAGSLDASLPTMSVVDPIVSIVIGAVAFGESIAAGPADVLLEVIALGAMSVGIFLLAQSEAVRSLHGTAPSPAK